MATSWNSWYVKCPFYLHDEKCKIRCEGVADGHNIVMQFATKQDFDIQIVTFCCDKYQNCEVYQMVKRKYDED